MPDVSTQPTATPTSPGSALPKGRPGRRLGRGVWIGAALLLLVGGGVVWRTHPFARPPATTPVVRRSLSEVVEVSGSVEAARAVTLRAEAGGRVAAREVPEGGTAKAGTLLLRLEDEQARLALAQARANAQSNRSQAETALASARRAYQEVSGRQGVTLTGLAGQVRKAEANLSFLESEAVRSRALAAEGALSAQAAANAEQQLAQARLDLKLARDNQAKAASGAEVVVARNQLAQAETALASAQRQGAAAVDLAEKALADTRVTAPFDGTLTSWQVDRGDGVTPGQPVAGFQDLAVLVLKLPVDELDLPKMRLGGTVELTFDAYPDRQVSGTIADVSRASVLGAGNVPVFPVKVRFTNPDGLIRPGMSADARVRVAERPNVLAVPLGAVRRDNGRLVVDVLVDRKPQARPITPGISTTDYLEVRDGLQEGEAVVFAGGPSPSPGARL